MKNFILLPFLICAVLLVGCKTEHNWTPDSDNRVANSITNLVTSFKTFDSASEGIIIKQSKDGNFYILSNSLDSNILLIKTNIEFEVLWKKSLGGKNIDFASDLLLTQNNGVIVLGQTMSFGNGNGHDYYVNKLSKEGELLWSKTYGNPKVDKANEIISLENENYLIIGSRLESQKEPYPHSTYLVKINNKGDLLEEKVLTEKISSIGHSIVKNDEGFVALIESIGNDSKKHLLIIAYDKRINELWRVDLGKTLTRGVPKIIKINDGFMVVNSRAEKGVKMVVSKINLKGEKEWEKLYGDKIQNYSSGIKKVSQNQFLIYGSTMSFNDFNRGMYIIKISDKGELIWSKIFGKEGYDNLRDVIETSSGDYILCGTTESERDSNNSELAILKINSGGEIID